MSPPWLTVNATNPPPPPQNVQGQTNSGPTMRNFTTRKLLEFDGTTDMNTQKKFNIFIIERSGL
jgi:hypothetical protein